MLQEGDNVTARCGPFAIPVRWLKNHRAICAWFEGEALCACTLPATALCVSYVRITVCVCFRVASAGLQKKSQSDPTMDVTAPAPQHPALPSTLAAAFFAAGDSQAGPSASDDGVTNPNTGDAMQAGGSAPLRTRRQAASAPGTFGTARTTRRSTQAAEALATRSAGSKRKAGGGASGSAPTVAADDTTDGGVIASESESAATPPQSAQVPPVLAPSPVSPVPNLPAPPSLAALLATPPGPAAPPVPEPAGDAQPAAPVPAMAEPGQPIHGWQPLADPPEPAAQAIVALPAPELALAPQAPEPASPPAQHQPVQAQRVRRRTPRHQWKTAAVEARERETREALAARGGRGSKPKAAAPQAQGTLAVRGGISKRGRKRGGGVQPMGQ